MNTFLTILIFISGLCIGSFLNVVIDRIPRNISLVKKRSYCDSCKKTLKWYDLIPLASFVFLKGKCRYCRSPLGLQYPIVEAVTGVLFVVTVLSQNSSVYQVISIKHIGTILYSLFIVSILIAIFFTDLKYGIIPEKITYPSIVMSFLYLVLNTEYFMLFHLMSAIGAFLFFFVLFFMTRGKGMGFGDVTFSFFMGLLLGFPQVILAFYLAFLTGAVVSIILITWGKKKFFGGTIPFGPFLVIGTYISILWGRDILRYISQFFLR